MAGNDLKTMFDLLPRKDRAEAKELEEAIDHLALFGVAMCEESSADITRIAAEVSEVLNQQNLSVLEAIGVLGLLLGVIVRDAYGKGKVH